MNHKLALALIATCIFSLPQQARAQLGALGAISSISGESSTGDQGPIIVKMAYPMQEGAASLTYAYRYTKYTTTDGKSMMTGLEDDNIYDRRIELQSDNYIYTIGLTAKTYISGSFQFVDTRQQHKYYDQDSGQFKTLEAEDKIVQPVVTTIGHSLKDDPEGTSHMLFLVLTLPTNYGSNKNAIDTKLAIASSKTIMAKTGFHHELGFTYRAPYDKFEHSVSGSGTSVNQIDPGDTISWNFAFSYPFSEMTTISFEFVNSYSFDSKTNGEVDEDTFQYSTRGIVGLKSVLNKHLTLISMVDNMLIDETQLGYYINYIAGISYSF